MVLLSISTNLILLISAAGVLSAIVLAAVLYFHPKSDRSVNLFLAIHILVISLFLVVPLTQHLYSWHTLILLIPFQFLIGPMLYLYIRSFKEVITWRKAWPHLIIFIVFFITDCQLFFSLKDSYDSSKQVPAEILSNPTTFIRVIIRNAQMIVYYFLTRTALTNYQHAIKHLFSDIKQISLSWIRWMINGFLIVVFSVHVLYFWFFKHPGYFATFILLLLAVIMPYICLITFRSLRQITIWQIMSDKNRQSFDQEIQKIEVAGSIKNHQHLLKENEIKEINSMAQQALGNEKLFLQPELNLFQLSDKIRVPPPLVTQAINSGLHKNFYELVNSYRLEDAKI